MSKFRSSFERLRQKFDETDQRCGKCGFVNPEGGWRVTAAGSQIHYQRVCPACDAIETRAVRLS